MFRKAGELVKAHPMPTAFVGGGSILGLLGVFQALSKPEQEAVLEAAVEEESNGGGTVLGVGSSGLLAAAAIAGMAEHADKDRQELEAAAMAPKTKEIIVESRPVRRPSV